VRAVEVRSPPNQAGSERHEGVVRGSSVRHQATLLTEAPGWGGVACSAAQMLAVGGVSGCTAAMFTTPFDVVKTRLQVSGAASRHRC
jgi:hypothetical protein